MVNANPATADEMFCNRGIGANGVSVCMSAYEYAFGVCAVVDAEDVYACGCVCQIEGVCVAGGIDVANDGAGHGHEADIDVLGSGDADFVGLGSGGSDKYALFVDANVIDSNAFQHFQICLCE